MNQDMKRKINKVKTWKRVEELQLEILMGNYCKNEIRSPNADVTVANVHLFKIDDVPILMNTE